MTPHLQTELWTSWASLLRAYAAAHGLNATHHAVVEVGPEEITLRVASQWLRFTHRTLQSNTGPQQPFSLTQRGTVLTGPASNPQEEEMDIAAERFARELLFA